MTATDRRTVPQPGTRFAEARSKISDFAELPEQYAERWLRAQYLVDPELHAAWNNRYASEDALRWCNNCVRHAIKNLHEEAKREAERIAGMAFTQDRDAIVAAMTRGSGGPIPEIVPRFGKLTDAELRKHVSDKYGYEPKF